MFTKIDIKKFGLYMDYTWPADMQNFGRVNIIYGRNYAGKTTLSRIFDSVGQGQLHKDYKDGEFTLYTDDGTVAEVTERNLSESPYMVRVYNSDFVRRNLSWLNNEEEGEIKPFALIGSENVVAQKAIDKLNEELGSVEEKRGLRYEYETENAAYEAENGKIREAEQVLEQKLKDKAKIIRSDVHFVSPGATYTVVNIKHDIETITQKDNLGMLTLDNSFSLKEAERKRLKLTVDQVLKPIINPLSIQKPNLKKYRLDIITLVRTKITLTHTLQELVEDDLLQAWVDQGRAVNKGRTTCAFCGNPISKKRWRELNAHYSKESEVLKRKLLKEKKSLESYRDLFDGFLESHYFTSQNIYVAYLKKYESLTSRWDVYVKEYKERIDELIGLIDERLKNIFIPVNVRNRRPDEKDPTRFKVVGKNYLRLASILSEMNALIAKNNDYSASLESEKEQARNKLRLDYVCSYCKDIKYAEEASRIHKENLGMMNWACNLNDMFKKIKKKESDIAQKELEKKDESLAAKRVTSLLANHFGNGCLSLEAEMEPAYKEDGGDMVVSAQTKFVVKRGGQYAKNLSEGEKSLISFCYFIAQMENELAGPDAGRIVAYIDDPISSLDSSHIFFMYSLIETIFVKNLCFGQLFISTHNLEFLKFTKRIRPVVTTGSKTISKYVVVKLGKGATDKYLSEIRTMPEYLSKYVTEYNFLFEEIYKVASLESDEDQALYDKQYTLYYNIGNNMRKFLECYLFNRYPNADDPLVMHLKDLFDENVPSEVNRVVNEYSHLVWAERGMKVMDVPEVVTAARQILKALQTKDKVHYDTLCKSVKVDENVIF